MISEALVLRCTEPMSEKFRCVDNITLKGSKMPMRLFTIDLYDRVLRLDYTPKEKLKNRRKMRQQREAVKATKLEESYEVHALFETDEDVRLMRKSYSDEFFQLFEKGYLNYEAGEWGVARDMFERTQHMLRGLPEDGPSWHLLQFMRDWDYTAPSNWPGHHQLNEK